jgi:hypothetical protein
MDVLKSEWLLLRRTGIDNLVMINARGLIQNFFCAAVSEEENVSATIGAASTVERMGGKYEPR